MRPSSEPGRGTRPTESPVARAKAITTIEVSPNKDAAVLRIAGIVDEQFSGFGDQGSVQALVIDVSEMTRMTSFGVRQWLKAMSELPASIERYLLGCPAFFVDQLNMVLNFSGAAKVLTVQAQYACGTCATESTATIDVLGDRSMLARGKAPRRACPRCKGRLELEENAESYFAFVEADGAETLHPEAARLLARLELYAAPAASEPPRPSRPHVIRNPTNDGTDDAVLGRYKIVRKLSDGSGADVFLANQIGIGGFEKPVVLQRIQRAQLAARPGATEAFLEEAKLAGRLRHGSIAQLLDVGDEGGALYVAMEYVPGHDLEAILAQLRTRGEKMPLPIACHIARETALALQHAYRSTDLKGNALSVLHRDISPRNIMVSDEGAIKVLGFGITLPEMPTTGFASPEHAGTPDHRSDLYSLGGVLEAMCPGAPGPLAALIERLRAPRPADRPQTAQEVAAALAEHARPTSSAGVARFLERLFSGAPLVDDAPAPSAVAGAAPEPASTPSTLRAVLLALVVLASCAAALYYLR